MPQLLTTAISCSLIAALVSCAPTSTAGSSTSGHSGTLADVAVNLPKAMNTSLSTEMNYCKSVDSTYRTVTALKTYKYLGTVEFVAKSTIIKSIEDINYNLPRLSPLKVTSNSSWNATTEKNSFSSLWQYENDPKPEGYPSILVTVMPAADSQTAVCLTYFLGR